ncbi:hypothetical protein BOTNAR_0045g00180 [Botryotinia narcissicola]|uniref:Uncharacterized protein n=1 Tax=Botryotinia narcissicola TaxID=278944 RepID=A0A4Z1J280_9HELO|nr:hypothetical protein BOTNAR_0045g00180 [Botryotinia narcissicola]
MKCPEETGLTQIRELKPDFNSAVFLGRIKLIGLTWMINFNERAWSLKREAGTKHRNLGVYEVFKASIEEHYAYPYRGHAVLEFLSPVVELWGCTRIAAVLLEIFEGL